VTDKRKLLDVERPVLKVLNVATRAADPTPDQLAQIRPFFLRDFEPEGIYIRQMMLANDQVDRSGERFDTGYLQRFAETIIGKSVLVGHDYGNAPIGRFFDASVERDEQGWQWVAPWFYMPVSAGNELERDNIDAGVWSYVSIGAAVDYGGLICDICHAPYYYWLANDESAPQCPHIVGEAYDGTVCTATWTAERSNMNRVEAVEGSIVYLGCQYEAAVSKSATQSDEARTAKLALVDNPPPQADQTEVSSMNIEELQAQLSAKTAECDEALAQCSDLTAKAEIGERLKARLVDEIKRLSACLGDEITPTVVDLITDVEKLIDLESKQSAAWAEKRGAPEPHSKVEVPEPTSESTPANVSWSHSTL
jgi:hypothetical protein